MRRRFASNIAVYARHMTVVCLLWPALSSAQLTPAQAAGKRIYREGAGSSNRQIEAVLGEGSTRVPGPLMPCAGCHGSDGKGRPEGGVVPSAITWEILAAPLRKADVLGRQRPAYSLFSLRRAIT